MLELSLTNHPAKDQILHTMVIVGWSWIIIAAHVEEAFPRLPSLIEKANKSCAFAHQNKVELMASLVDHVSTSAEASHDFERWPSCNLCSHRGNVCPPLTFLMKWTVAKRARDKWLTLWPQHLAAFDEIAIGPLDLTKSFAPATKSLKPRPALWIPTLARKLQKPCPERRPLPALSLQPRALPTQPASERLTPVASLCVQRSKLAAACASTISTQAR